MHQGSLFAPPEQASEAALQRDMQACAVRIANQMELNKYPAWEGSPFRPYKSRSPTVTGLAMEACVQTFLAHQGFLVTPRTVSAHDVVVNGLRVEVKGSTVQPAGRFQFNQIRDQGGYSHVILLGFTPRRARMWVEEKHTIRRIARNQHAGDPLTKFVAIEPDWLGPDSDGSLACAMDRLRSLVGP